MRRTTLDRLVLVGFVIVAVLLYLSTADYRGIAQTTSARYVQFLAVAFGGLSALQLLFSLRGAAGDERPLDLVGRVDRFVMLVVALIAFAVAFKPLGFFLSALVFLPAVSLALGYRNLLVIALTTGGVIGVVWLLFVRILAVNLPGASF